MAKTVQAVDRANEAQAQAEQAEQAQALVEEAWRILVDSGIVTQEDRRVIEQRRRDRELLALAARTLTEAGQGAVSVAIATERWVYIAEVGESPRVIPRTTATPRKASRAKSEDKADKAEANGKPEDSAGIPVEYLKKASDQLGLKWFGPANAARSKRVVELARKMAGQAEA